MSIERAHAVHTFESFFGFKPEIAVRAPGRVNIIGEHTDYNDGFVLPMAIGRETMVIARRRSDNLIRAYAANLNRTGEIALDRVARHPIERWTDYIAGVTSELTRMGKAVHGADVAILGDIPIASGLSSSASLEMAALKLFEVLGEYEIDGPEAARLGQRVENDFLGLNSGIMDQFISRMAIADHALFLDCRSYVYTQIPVRFDNAAFVIANTGVSRGLTASKYNERVSECGRAVRKLCEFTGKTGTHLRDFTIEELQLCKERLDDVVYRRARHVITENVRTADACEEMKKGNAEALGRLLNESDESLRCDYEVTCPELDVMTAIARALPGAYGSRMTGAGFGGCTVSLVVKSEADSFCERLLAEYAARTGKEGSIIVSNPADGARATPL